METLHGWLQQAQLLLFLVAAAAAVRLWIRHRGRPAAFLALAFGTLGLTLLLSRLVPAGTPGPGTEPLRDVVIIGLAAFPWLLALFAWSFEPRFPRWLLSSGLAVLALSVWALVLPPLPLPGEPRTTAVATFIGLFILVWSILSLTAAARLWTVGAEQPLARARTRTMALGAFLLTAALLLAGAAPAGAEVDAIDVLTVALAILAALLFIGGFAPPRALRVWWRRRATEQWPGMQTALIAALTHQEAAEAVTPLFAEMLGNAVVVVSADGDLLAFAGLDADEAHAIAFQVRVGDELSPGDEVVAAGSAKVVMRSSRYTPLFGQDERDLVAGFALQLRLAFERADLFESNQRARRDLERASRELQTMTRELAHDLRNTAIVINGFADLLPEMETAEERERAIDRIQQSGEYLRRLTDSLAKLARAGVTPDNTGPVDLQVVASRVVERLRASSPGVTVDLNSLPTIHADPLGMEQVFENLLTNAVKHGGRDDLRVVVRHHVHGSRLLIDVMDDGTGISAEDRETVFLPFRRGHNTGAEGSGVGLGLVRRIVEAHTGTIELVDSEHGAHFRIDLPIDAAVPGTHPALVHNVDSPSRR